jgi:hypothetical protein
MALQVLEIHQRQGQRVLVVAKRLDLERWSNNQQMEGSHVVRSLISRNVILTAAELLQKHAN